jgi:hypothetical protein
MAAQYSGAIPRGPVRSVLYIGPRILNEAEHVALGA